MALKVTRVEIPDEVVFVKAEVKKQAPKYKITIFKATDRLASPNEELYSVHSTSIPKHENEFVTNNRLMYFILDVMNDPRCFKSKRTRGLPKSILNRKYMMEFQLLGEIPDIDLDTVKEHMPELESMFDGWAFLSFDRFDKLSKTNGGGDKFFEIAEGYISSHIYILYERV